MVFLSLITRPSSITDCKQETALSIFLSIRSSLGQKKTGNIKMIHHFCIGLRRFKTFDPLLWNFLEETQLCPVWGNFKNEQTCFSSLFVEKMTEKSYCKTKTAILK